MPQSPKPSLIVYGNCQSEAVTTIFNAEPTLSERYEMVYVPAYDHPTRGNEGATDAQLARCQLLLEQHDRTAFPLRDRLPATAKTVTFPSIDFNLLWPLTCVNPYNQPEEGMPFGRFAYGDRAILSAVNSGKSAQEVFEYYVTSWDEYKPDLRRLEQLERSRIEMRDSRCDVKMANTIAARFRDVRCFWTVNHPVANMLAELTKRLVTAAFPRDAKLRKIDFADFIVSHFSPRGPLGTIAVPIHPDVAEYLQLAWYDFEEKYRMADGSLASYDEYFFALITRSIEGKVAAERAEVAS